MSTSTPYTFTTLPATLSRPAIHDGRSDRDELIKLVNQHRQLVTATYKTAFQFTTPGDGAAHIAWQAQLSTDDTWFATCFVTATSAAGDGAAWLRQALLVRSGTTVTVAGDVSVANMSTASLVGFSVSWSASSLYGQLNLTDVPGTIGKWKVSLEVMRA